MTGTTRPKQSVPITVGIAIRPLQCVIKHSGNPKPIRKRIPTLASCLRFIHSTLSGLTKEGEHTIDSCVVSMVGDVDSNKRLFLGSSIGGPQGGWQREIDFEKELSPYVSTSENRKRLLVFNDATMAAYKVFQNYKDAVGTSPFLLITVREWGIGFGLVYKNSPWSFGRNPELSHIPAVGRAFPAQPMIEDISTDVCAFHNSDNVPCIADRACGDAADERSRSDVRDRLRKYFGSEESGYQFEALYLAQACAVGAAAYSPEQIVLSGCYVSQEIVDQVWIWFQHLTQNFPRHDSSDFLAYETDENADIDGAVLLARDTAHELSSTTMMKPRIRRS